MLKRVVVGVAVILVGAAMLAVPASAVVNDTTRPATNEAVGLISELKLGNVILVRESVEPNTAEFMRTADSHTVKKVTIGAKKKRRPGTQSLATTGNSTQAPAPLDCSIESHPDCPDSEKTGSIEYLAPDRKD
jgi:hypothetical protein